MKGMTRIAIHSVTGAMQARELLKRHGINSTVVRLYQGESPGGCMFGLELSYHSLQAAYTLLSKAEIKYTRLHD